MRQKNKYWLRLLSINPQDNRSRERAVSREALGQKGTHTPKRIHRSQRGSGPQNRMHCARSAGLGQSPREPCSREVPEALLPLVPMGRWKVGKWTGSGSRFTIFTYLGLYAHNSAVAETGLRECSKEILPLVGQARVGQSAHYTAKLGAKPTTAAALGMKSR